jgi:hypothetical protein
MSKQASGSRENRPGLLGRWKDRIGKVLNLSSRAETGQTPRPDPRQEGTLSLPPAPIRKSAEASPAPHVENEVSLLPGHTGIYEHFRNKIIEISFALRRVEEDMWELGESYRTSMPPTRLQLYPWAFPKGSPPRALYWVRLCRKLEEPCDQFLTIVTSKRPRWNKRLKIRSRRDLEPEIYFNRLDSHRKTVYRYYDAACSLNKAHRTLAMRLHGLQKTFHRSSGGLQAVQGYSNMPLEDPAYDHLNGVQHRLLACSWQMQWVVEKDIARLNELLSQSGFSTVRLTIKEPRGGGVFVGFVWEDATTRLAFASFERGHWLSPGTDSVARERNELVNSLGARIELVRVALSRLQDIAAAAEADLQVWKAESPSLIPSGEERLFLRKMFQKTPVLGNPLKDRARPRSKSGGPGPG